MTSYLPRTKPAPFPRDLAEKIARKADAMARRFEEQAIEQLVRDTRRALSRGEKPEEIARQLGL